MRPFLVSIVAVALAGCGAALPEPTATHVARLRVNDPSVSLGDLERGRSLYVARCAGCHTLKEPRRFSAEAWVTALEKMEAQEGVKLEASESRDIQRYLVAMSTSETRTSEAR
jgi:mono/diheme cytochrome c family protein